MRTTHLFVISLASFIAACAEGASHPENEGSDDGRGGAGGQGGSTATQATSTSTSAGQGGGGGGGSGGSGVPCDYKSPNTCNTGVQMASIAGDAGAQIETQYGATSQWITVRIEETKFDPADQDENPLSYTVTLKSPPGMDYDVYVQVGQSDGGVVCGGVAVKGAGQGGVETVKSGWNDDVSFGDDKDDHRYLSIEVRYVSGAACGAAAQWTLTVAGHT